MQKEVEIEILKLQSAGYSYAEISEKTGIKVGTVSSTLNRIRRAKMKDNEGGAKCIYKMRIMTHKDFGLAKAAGVRSRYKDSQNY